MKTKNFEKLYPALSNKERAILAFNFYTEKNDLEIRRVESSVSRKTYTCPDIEYQDWLDGMFHLSLLWGLHHWRLSSQLMSYLNIMGRHDDNLKAYQVRETAAKIFLIQAQLLALDKALLSLCEQHHFEAEAIFKMAMATPFEPINLDVLPDNKFYEEMSVNLSACFSFNHQ